MSFLYSSKKYLETFFEDLEASVNTISAYKRDLRLYVDFTQKNSDLSNFYKYIDQKGLGPRSKARVISSVRTYLKSLEQKGKKTQLKKLKPVPVDVHLPQPVSLEEFKKIYHSAQIENEHLSARNHITLLLLFGLGCRVSEIIGLNLRDVNELDNSLIVTGKGQKQRLLPLTKDLSKQLGHYIRQHRPFLIKNPNHSSILINNKGHRPSRVDIWRWLADWSKKAGFSKVKGPHQFRHGFATGLLENEVDLRSIQFFLGHSSIQTTQIYTSVKKDHLKKLIKKHHPLSFIEKSKK